MLLMAPLLLLLILQTLAPPSQAAQTVKQGKWSQDLGRWMLLPEASSLPLIYENPDSISWREAVTLCEENHANPFVPAQPSEWFWLVKKAKSLNGLSMWLPMSDNMTEGVLSTWDGQDFGDLPVKWLREDAMIHNSDTRNCVLLSAEWGYRAIMAPCEDHHAAMICVAQEERCCMAGPPETEAFIAKAGTKEVAAFMAEGKKNVYESFHNILSRSVSGFKKGFTSSYLQAHGELFSNLESELQTYYLSGQENLTIDLVEDFRKIYQSVFIYQQQGDESCPAPDSFGHACFQYYDQCSSNDDCEGGQSCCLVAGCGHECVAPQKPNSYNECIGKAMDALYPFASLYELEGSIIKTMIVMRTLTKGFGTGEKAMNGILKASPPNRACWKEFPKMIQCLKCGLPMKPLPCRGYCEQVTNLCFRHTLPLVPVWYDLIDEMGKLIDILKFPTGKPNGLLEHPFEKILSLITEAFNGAEIQCGDSELPNALQSTSITNEDVSDESSEEADDKYEENEEGHEDDEELVDEDEDSIEENADTNNDLQHLLIEIKDKLVWYREFWADLPSEMCRENPRVGEGTCRNQSMAKKSANSPVPVSDPNNPTKMELQIQLIDNFNTEVKTALSSARGDQEIVLDPQDTPIYEKPEDDFCVSGHEAVVGNECIVAYNKQQVSRDGVDALCQEKEFELPQLIDIKHIEILKKTQDHTCCCCHLSANSSYWTSGRLSKEKSTKTFNKWVWPSGHLIAPEDCPACYDGTNEAECLTWSPESGLMPADCYIENPVLCQRPNPDTPPFLQVSMPQIPDQYAWLNGRLVTVPDSADSVTFEEASELCSEENLTPYMPWNMQEFNDMPKIYEILNFDSSEGFWLPAAVYKEGGSISWIGQRESEVKVETHSKHMTNPSDLPEGQVYSLIMPDDTSSGSSATLECLWTDTDSIHAVMWFKDDVNFFTYWADRNVSELAQNVLGITINVNASTGEHITLSNLTSDSSGRYRCEVMLDEPSYSMTYLEGNLLVTEKLLWWNENPPFEWSGDENQCISYSKGATFYPCEEMLLPMICEYTGDTTTW